MVIKTEMYPWGDYKQMSYSHEEEKMYTENYYNSNNGSTMQMVRPNNPTCISTGTPHQPPYNHHLAGKYHQHHGHKHSDYFNKEKMHDYKEKHHYGDGHMVQETIMFSSDKLVSSGGPSHVVMAPNKHETRDYSGDRRHAVHYFQLKNLDD
ncbi:PREDICTED: uncharacterized protein LOC109157456 isoform X2 [Ipomoea nil]|uniref:uncharacterized protein LOC109157456 isoform X2 n=1 Tax=Ipomoea nil TaxID=35883 RepID=UPI000900DA95|nr:PREDICTED: uncharacterized protein LOC109157456 isoform X2 [Ipomoea nil]